VQRGVEETRALDDDRGLAAVLAFLEEAGNRLPAHRPTSGR
jgi:hypothetical protein